MRVLYHTRQTTALLFVLMPLPGRVMRRSRRLIIRLAADNPGLELVLAARRTILALARGAT